MKEQVSRSLNARMNERSETLSTSGYRTRIAGAVRRATMLKEERDRCGSDCSNELRLG